MHAFACDLRDSGTGLLILFRFEAHSVGLKPKGSAEGAVTSEVWNGRQITAGNVESFSHPTWIEGDTLPGLRRVAYEMASLQLPSSAHRGP
jgi:hypothetical protein